MGAIGLIPVAGKATRINGLPKYLLPVPEGNLLALHVQRMLATGAQKVLIGAGSHNAGLIYQYAPSGTETYIVNTKTMSETVLGAHEAAGDNTVLFGMGDTYWRDPEVYARLLYKVQECGADVALALWRIRDDQRGQLGMVDWRNDYARRIVDKDPDCPFEWAWGALAWSPKFWPFIQKDQVHVGYAVQTAIDAGLKVWVATCEGDYWDCGSFENYARLCNTFVTEMVTHGA